MSTTLIKLVMIDSQASVNHNQTTGNHGAFKIYVSELRHETRRIQEQPIRGSLELTYVRKSFHHLQLTQ